MHLIAFLKLVAGKWRNTAVSVNDPLPVAATITGGTIVGTLATDGSGTITLGGTAQNALAANTSRREWTFINSSDTPMMLRIGATASATAGFSLSPGDMASGQETNAISVYCATTGKAFTAWER